MRRILLILALVLISGMIIHAIYEFFVANEGIRYFSVEPRRLLYVAVLGLGGRIAAFGISWLSPSSQRRLKLIALGGFGGFLMAGIVFFGYLLYLLAAAPQGEAKLWGWIAAAFCAVGVAAVMVWMEFLKVWRQAR